jgi:hypothetical protein
MPPSNKSQICNGSLQQSTFTLTLLSGRHTVFSQTEGQGTLGRSHNDLTQLIIMWHALRASLHPMSCGMCGQELNFFAFEISFFFFFKFIYFLLLCLVKTTHNKSVKKTGLLYTPMNQQL